MPYRWEHTTSPAEQAELHLWPHQSLSAHGFSIFILSFFLLALMPFFGLLGTVLLWGLLPFMLAAVAGLWFAIKRNSRDRQVLEILTLGRDFATTNLEFKVRGRDLIGRQSQTWIKFDDVGWKVVAAHVSTVGEALW